MSDPVLAGIDRLLERYGLAAKPAPLLSGPMVGLLALAQDLARAPACLGLVRLGAARRQALSAPPLPPGAAETVFGLLQRRPELADRLAAGGGTPEEIVADLLQRERELGELAERALELSRAAHAGRRLLAALLGPLDEELRRAAGRRGIDLPRPAPGTGGQRRRPAPIPVSQAPERRALGCVRIDPECFSAAAARLRRQAQALAPAGAAAELPVDDGAAAARALATAVSLTDAAAEQEAGASAEFLGELCSRREAVMTIEEAAAACGRCALDTQLVLRGLLRALWEEAAAAGGAYAVPCAGASARSADAATAARGARRARARAR